MTFLARITASLARAPRLRPNAARVGVRARNGASALAVGLLALALLVAGTPGAARNPHVRQASAGQSFVDAGSPPLRATAIHVADAITRAQRRTAGDNAPAWTDAPALRAARSDSARTTRALAALPPRSAAASGFDATAPPLAV